MDLLCAAFQRGPASVDGILDRMLGAMRKIGRMSVFLYEARFRQRRPA